MIIFMILFVKPLLHSQVAEVALYHDWDWEEAESLFKRALDLNPSLAMTHYHYARYLALFDRLDEAIEEHKLARDLDPLRALHTAWLGSFSAQEPWPSKAPSAVS